VNIDVGSSLTEVADAVDDISEFWEVVIIRSRLEDMNSCVGDCVGVFVDINVRSVVGFE
jgi:hypothetical protein